MPWVTHLCASREEIEAQHGGGVPLKGLQAAAVRKCPQPQCLVTCVVETYTTSASMCYHMKHAPHQPQCLVTYTKYHISLNVLSHKPSTTSASVSCHLYQLPHQPVHHLRHAARTHRQSSVKLVVHSMFALHTSLKASCPEAGCTRCHDLHHGRDNTSWLKCQILLACYAKKRKVYVVRRFNHASQHG